MQALVDVGQTWSIDLADWVPAGWVGSAHVFSDDAVTAIVDRYKAGTNMWITNTASNAAAENYWQYPTGPDGTAVRLVRAGRAAGLQRLEHRHQRGQHG